MNINENYTIDLTPKYVKKHMRKQYANLFKRKRIKRQYNEILTDFPKKVKTKLVWDRFQVKKYEKGKLILKNNKKNGKEENIALGGGPGLEVIKNAKELVMGAMTIGPEVDKEIEQAQETKELMRGVILDAMGSWVVSHHLGKFEKELDEKLEDENMFRSICITPGSIDWPITDQKILFNLLKPEKIGMSLTDSMLMLPQKSLSFVIGVSDEPFGLDDKSKCDYCHRKERCRFSNTKENKANIVNTPNTH